MSTLVCNITKQEILNLFRQKISTMDFTGPYMVKLKQSLMSVTDRDIEIGEYISFMGQQATFTVEYEAEGLKVNNNLGTVQSKSKQGVKQYKVAIFPNVDKSESNPGSNLAHAYAKSFGCSINWSFMGIIYKNIVTYFTNTDLDSGDWVRAKSNISEYEAREYFDKMHYKLDTFACIDASVEPIGDKFECGGWPVKLHFIDPDGVAQNIALGTVIFDNAEDKASVEQKFADVINKYTFKKYKDKQDKANSNQKEQEDNAKKKKKLIGIAVAVVIVFIISLIVSIQ